MIIGIDGNEANVLKKVGVSVYTAQLLKYFKQKSSKDTRFLIYLREAPQSHMPTPGEFFQYRVIWGRAFWLQFFLSGYLQLRREVDVFFSPAHYSPRFCPVPLVVTIHDLSYLFYRDEFLKKDLYKLTNWTRDSVKNASKILAVSKTTKKDILKEYSIADEKVSVVYNGFEKSIADDSKWPAVAERYQLQKNKYILYVGTLQPRKDIPTLIEAFTQFQKKHTEYKLVIVGKKGWMYEKILKLAPHHAQPHIVFTDYLPDEEVVALYQNAFCYTLPSLYEGFGIPLLEAMSYGCPVITSYASSLPEIGGEACLYFEPKNIEDLLFNMELLQKDSSLRSELIQKGKERITHFSWSRSAEETLSILKSV